MNISLPCRGRDAYKPVFSLSSSKRACLPNNFFPFSLSTPSLQSRDKAAMLANKTKVFPQK